MTVNVVRKHGGTAPAQVAATPAGAHGGGALGGRLCRPEQGEPPAAPPLFFSEHNTDEVQLWGADVRRTEQVRRCARSRRLALRVLCVTTRAAFVKF